MIGHWPDPLPGELLYSVAARYQVRVDYPNLKSVTAELFGPGCALATVDLPRGIDYLVASLPPGHRYTADGLIDAHTMFPFYCPFLPEARRRQVRADMRASSGAAALLRSGIIAGGIPAPEFLRTCPCCDAENQVRYGETYWHRLYQLTGIEVCPIHRVFLEDTDARRRHARTRHGFIAAQDSCRVSEARPINPDDAHHRCLLRLARAAQWLLENVSDDRSLALYALYRQALTARDLASVDGRSVRWLAVRRVFAARFPTAFLRACGSEPGGDCDWLARLLHSEAKAQAPLRHLLFMDAFDLNVRGEHEQSSGTFDGPFGKGPWHCHGSVCSQHGQPIITGFRVERGGKRGVAVGIFTCNECGFAYGRAVQKTGRSEKPFDFVRDYGGCWRETLVRLWADGNVSLRAISRALHADPLTVKRHAVDLGLVFPRSAIRPIHRPHSPHRLPGSDGRKRPGAVVPADRCAWLRALSALPGIGVAQVRTDQPALYARLYRGDREWLRKHTGLPVLPAPRSLRVDWLERDWRLANSVAKAAARLKTVKSSRPQMVSRAALARTVKASALIQHNPDRLPLTLTALDTGAESRVEYALRRITWAAQILFEEVRWQISPLAPRLWELERKAGLRPELLKSEPRVGTALASAHAGLLARLAMRSTDSMPDARAA